MIFILFVLIIILQAAADGLWERNLKKWSKRAEHMSIFLFFLIPLFIPEILNMPDRLKFSFNLLILYISLRTALFDPVMHSVAGWPVNTIGTTSPLWDDLMGRLKSWQFWVMRIFFLGFSVFWYYMTIVRF